MIQESIACLHNVTKMTSIKVKVLTTKDVKKKKKIKQLYQSKSLRQKLKVYQVTTVEMALI